LTLSLRAGPSPFGDWQTSASSRRPRRRYAEANIRSDISIAGSRPTPLDRKSLFAFDLVAVAML
jgi:hypothetical protein